MDLTNDSDLVALARSGNRNAFGRLIERYQIVAKSIALRMINHEDLAREVVQEAILQALLSLDRLRDNDRFKSWYYGIVINICRQYLRHRDTMSLSLEDLEAVGAMADVLPFVNQMNDPQDLVEERELSGLLLSALEDLSEPNRETVILYYYRYLSLQETAEALCVSTSAVKVRLHRARAQLREGLLQKYPEIDLFVSVEQRSKTMIPVKIVDIIQHQEKHILLLLDGEGQRLLPIWIGEFEAASIAIGLRGMSIPRPLTHRLIANMLEVLETELEEARIEALKEDTFYGVAKLRRGDWSQEVDARPSDILALAVQTGSPIYVGEEVIEQAGIDVSDRDVETSRLGEGIDAIIKKVEEMRSRAHSEMEGQDMKRVHQELLDSIFVIS